MRSTSLCYKSCLLTVSVTILGLVTASPTQAEQPAISEIDRQLSNFHSEYALEEKQLLKHVRPPFPESRLAYYKAAHANQAKLLPDGPDYMSFSWNEDAKPSRFSHRNLHWKQMGWVGSKGPSLPSIVELATGVPSYLLKADAETRNIRVPGDWVVRDGAPTAPTIKQLEQILNSQPELNLRLAYETRELSAWRMVGTYNYQPLPDRGQWFDEQKFVSYDRLEVFTPDDGERFQSLTVDVDGLCDYLSTYLNQPVINVATSGPEDMFSFLHSPNRLRGAKAGQDHSDEAEEIFARIEKQTGLRCELTKVERQVLVVERVAKNRVDIP